MKEGIPMDEEFRKDFTELLQLMDAGKLLFGRITHKETKGRWLKIRIKIYLHE